MRILFSFITYYCVGLDLGVFTSSFFPLINLSDQAMLYYCQIYYLLGDGEVVSVGEGESVLVGEGESVSVGDGESVLVGDGEVVTLLLPTSNL